MVQQGFCIEWDCPQCLERYESEEGGSVQPFYCWWCNVVWKEDEVGSLEYVQTQGGVTWHTIA